MVISAKDDGQVCFAACPQHAIDAGQCVCNNRFHNLVRLVEVVVTFKEENMTYKSIWVRETLTKDEITKQVNKELGTNWYSYDIQK